MRLDRNFSEGEAQVALRELGFDVHMSEGRPNFFEVSHPNLGGARTMTVDQLTMFAEGVASAEQLVRGVPSGEPA
jgi:hypothetical protein